MSSDIDVLRFFMEAKQFRSTAKAYPAEMFDSQDTKKVLKWFDYYFSKFRDDEFIDVDKLSLQVKLAVDSNPNTFKIDALLLDQLRTPIDPVVKANLQELLEERKFVRELELAVAKYNAGEEVQVLHDVLKLATDANKRSRSTHACAWEDGDVYEMALAEADESGYFFDFLPKKFWEQVRGLNEGDNFGVAADTNVGKTSFLVKIAESFAKQRKVKLEDYHKMVNAPDWVAPDDHVPMVFRPVLYLINESNSKKITPRIYQSALNCDRATFLQYGATGVLNSKYAAVMGRRDAIRCVNIHGFKIQDVIKIIESHNPFLVITDMTGRIKDYHAQGANDVQQLENVWNTLREQAEILNFIHCGTVQISNEGKNMFYPPLAALQQSKTGIQTTWDFSIYLGSETADGKESYRGISTPKSKRARQGCSDYIQMLTVFDKERNAWKLSTDE